MSDWEIRRNPDGTIDEIVAHGVDLHLEQMAKNAWSFNVYTNEAPSHNDNLTSFLQADIYSKKKVTVFVEDGQDVYPKPVEIDRSKPPSMENLSKSVAIDDDLEAVATAVGAFVEAATTAQQAAPVPPAFIKFPSGEITP